MVEEKKKNITLKKLIVLKKSGLLVMTSKDIPSKRVVIGKIKELGLDKHILYHTLAVSRKAIKIGSEIRSVPVDIKLVRIGAILHDIGRTRSHGLDHAAYGADIIRDLGWSEDLARITETHILGGLKKSEAKDLNIPIRDYMPRSIEEKIVCLSDKYHIGSRKVSIEHRFKNWYNRFGKTELLLTARKRVERLELEIYRLMYP